MYQFLRIPAIIAAIISIVIANFGNRKPDAPQPVVETASLVYSKNCAQCHGSKGQGNTAVGLLGLSAEDLASTFAPKGHHWENPLENKPRFSPENFAQIAEWMNSELPRRRAIMSGFIYGVVTPKSDAQIAIMDGKGRIRRLSSVNGGVFILDVQDLYPPFFIRTRVGGRSLYSFSNQAGTINVSPLTDLIVRHAIARQGVAPLSLFKQCARSQGRCAMQLLPKDMHHAFSHFLQDFDGLYKQVGLREGVNPIETPFAEMDHQLIEMLASLESRRLVECKNPVNPYGYIYQDDKNRDCYHDDDSNFDGFHD